MTSLMSACGEVAAMCISAAIVRLVCQRLMSETFAKRGDKVSAANVVSSAVSQLGG